MRRFEWNERKNEANRRKHGVAFEDARLVFDDPFHLAFVERVERGEERWHAIGSVEGVIVLAVVHTYRQQGSVEIIRIVSARRATPRERKLYAQAISEET